MELFGDGGDKRVAGERAHVPLPLVFDRQAPKGVVWLCKW